MKKDITTLYQSSYATKFILDSSSNFSRLQEMDLKRYDRVFIVIDKNVATVYQKEILKKMDFPESQVYIHGVEAKEHTKSIDYYPTLVSFFEEHTAGRYDAVIAIGGGIVIDLVSFTVSTYMRGLPLFIIATTLIGQTDASTAGKTCLNSYNSKNLLGTFYYPQIVYNNIEMLRTNSGRILRQGLSEAFKYSLLTDGKLLDDIIAFQCGEFDQEIMHNIVFSTINARIAIRKIDPLASNLGHTFGHALEKYSNYKILHGDAILVGTVMAIYYAVEKQLMEKEEAEKIFSLMNKAKLNIYIPENLDCRALLDFMKKDKKSSSKKLHLVMIHGIGRPYRGETPFYEAEYEDVYDFLVDFSKSYQYKKSNLSEYLLNDTLEKEESN